MASKGVINEIIDVKAAKSQIDYLKTELDAINTKYAAFAAAFADVNTRMKGAKGMSDVNEKLKEQAVLVDSVTKNSQKHKDVTTQLAVETARLNSLNNGGAAAEIELLKIKTQRIAREKELLAQAREAINSGSKQTKSTEEQIASAKRQVNTIRAIEEETKKLYQIKKDIILVEGKENAQIKEINAMIDKNTAILRANGDEATKQRMNIGNYSSAWDGVKGALGLVTAAIASASGAIAFSKSVIESTGATAREFKAITTGMSWAWDEFKKAIATSDFSNLLTNMGDAIAAGREYVNILADVKKSTRALSITNSELNIEFQKQKVIERDVSKTKEERIAAGKKALEIEMKMTQDSQAVAGKAMGAELLHLRTITGLRSKEDKRKTESDLAFKNRVEAENKAYDEQIKAAVSTYNSNKKNLDLANEYNKALETTSAKNSQATSQTRNTAEGEAAYQRVITLVKTASPEIKRLAGVMKAMGKTTGEELDAMAEKWVAFNTIESESIQKTARVKITLGRLEKGIIDEGVREEEKNAKQLEKQIGAYAKLKQSISDMKQTQLDMLASGKTPSEEFLAELKKQEIQLYNIGEAAKNATLNIVEMQKGKLSKGISLNGKNKAGSGSISAQKSTLPEAAATRIDSEYFGSNMGLSKEEAKNWAVEEAQVTSDAAFSIVSNSMNAEFDLKMSLLEKQREAELANKNLTEKQKAAINEKYAKKEAQLKEQQFKKQKAADIIQAIINTALAITKAGAVTPMAIAAAIAGAAQIAVIAAQPIPKYFKGRDGGPAEWAIVGEQGQEAIRYPGGKTSLTPDHATMTYLPAGAKVIPNKDLIAMSEAVSFTKVPEYSAGISATDIKKLREEIAGLYSGFEMLAHVVKNKTEHHINITERGIWASSQRGASRAEYINDNIRF